MKRFLFFVILAGVLVIALPRQFRSYEQMGERRTRELSLAGKEVLVGVCWPFSVNRDGMADGLRLALDEINSHALAGPYKIRLVMRDDKFDWQRSKRIARKFADTPGMSAVIGYYDDSPAVKASTIYEASSLLHLIAGANNTAMTRRGFQYIVRTTLSSERIARSLARLTSELGYHRVALIWEEDAYGEDLAYQYNVGLDNLNIRMVYTWSYSREHADFRALANELKAVNADIVFFSGIEPWAGDFIRVARGVGLKTPILGAFSDTPEMRKRAGLAREGAMYFDIYDVGSRTSENLAFAAKFRSRFGREPDAWAAQGYDALRILAKAIQFTGSCNPLDLSYAIRYMDAWEGANGRYKFTSQGELEDKPLFLMMYRHGTPVMLRKCPPVIAPAH